MTVIMADYDASVCGVGHNSEDISAQALILHIWVVRAGYVNEEMKSYLRCLNNNEVIHS